MILYTFCARFLCKVCARKFSIASKIEFHSFFFGSCTCISCCCLFSPPPICAEFMTFNCIFSKQRKGGGWRRRRRWCRIEKKRNLFLLLRIFTWRGRCWLSTTLRSNGNNINVKYKKYKSNWLQLYFERGLECVRCNEPVYSFNEQETQQFFFATLAFFPSSFSLRRIRSAQFFIH